MVTPVKMAANWRNLTEIELKQIQVQNKRKNQRVEKGIEEQREREQWKEFQNFSVKICLMIIIASLYIYTQDQS